MAYFPNNISERYARSALSESRLTEGSSSRFLLGSQVEPHITAEAYTMGDGETTYVAESLAGLGAQELADIIQAPLGEYTHWSYVQKGLRHISHQRRAISRGIRRLGSISHLQALREDSFNVAHSMALASGERKVRAQVDIVRYDLAEEAVRAYLRDISTEELRLLMSHELGVEIDAKRFSNWAKAHRKNPNTTDNFEKFFADLEAEMLEEGYRVDDNSDVTDNLNSDELDDIMRALWMKLFRELSFYYDEKHGSFPPPDVPYARVSTLPPIVPDNPKTRLQLSSDAMDRFMLRGQFSGKATFRFPATGYAVRPVLIWTKAADGARRFRFDAQPFGYDAAREQVYYRSPIVGAAALAAEYGDFETYHKRLSEQSPFVRMPKDDLPSVNDRAGLWPLVADVAQAKVLDNSYVRLVESVLDRPC